ncbi:helix-turn-helix transcriptional regulator [Streptomyces sp. HPF1205]|uniref:helix-turn-helix transcriptional regulator n=1 Tax=Streptomyces sp. HPF1205 TaxID=2873262 RepID=UPI001CEC0B66|nr:AraC family transcriptional regulator [Streptomyces sp. HPF1205]
MTATQAEAAAASQLAAVERAVARMQDNLADQQCLTDHAEAGLFSPYHFHRVFRSVTSVTPARFLAALRMAEAQRLIIRESPRIIDVCAAVGYSSLGTFTTQFTQLVGLSPRRYQALVRRYGQCRMGDLLPEGTAGPAVAEGQGLAGHVSGPYEHGICLTGLFPHGVPQRAPAGCAVSHRLGRVVLPVPPPAPRQPDLWQILAVWFPAGLRVVDVLDDSTGANRRVGGTTIPLRHGAGPDTPFQVTLRRPAPSDPPLVYALPLVLAERRPRLKG